MNILASSFGADLAEGFVSEHVSPRVKEHVGIQIEMSDFKSVTHGLTECNFF